MNASGAKAMSSAACLIHTLTASATVSLYAPLSTLLPPQGQRAGLSSLVAFRHNLGSVGAVWKHRGYQRGCAEASGECGLVLAQARSQSALQHSSILDRCTVVMTVWAQPDALLQDTLDGLTRICSAACQLLWHSGLLPTGLRQLHQELGRNMQSKSMGPSSAVRSYPVIPDFEPTKLKTDGCAGGLCPSACSRACGLLCWGGKKSRPTYRSITPARPASPPFCCFRCRDPTHKSTCFLKVWGAKNASNRL